MTSRKALDERETLRAEISRLKRQVRELLQPADGPSDPLRSAVEAARQLGTTPAVLNWQRSRGTWNLPFIKIGRRVYYRQSSIDAWISSQPRFTRTGQAA